MVHVDHAGRLDPRSGEGKGDEFLAGGFADAGPWEDEGLREEFGGDTVVRDPAVVHEHQGAVQVKGFGEEKEFVE